MKLNIFDEIPKGFLRAEPWDLATVLPGPSLIRLPGILNPPLFLATLLHGNEPSGVRAIQKLLAQYADWGKKLPRSLIIFIGNVHAARQNVRYLENQLDYNRVWKGGPAPEHELARQVIREATADGLFASVDIHNSSGRNPHYACLNRLDPAFLNLCELFSNIVVYFTKPDEVLSNAFADYCPSITLEDGQPHDPTSVQHVITFLEQCLNLEEIPDTRNDPHRLNIYHSVARIQVPPSSRVEFDQNNESPDFRFIENLDLLNFSQVSENTLLGWRFNAKLNLSVQGENGMEMEAHYIDYQGSEIRLKRAVVPSLLTTDARVVHQDCLGYLMERYPVS